MELTRLKELMAVQPEAEVIVEAKKSEADFAGIARIVDDCLADLKDKLGKGGSLATLFKTSGASKLDTVKDENGKNVLAQIIALTADYKKSIESLMMEAELLVNQGQPIAEGLIQEASSDYSDSSEFTDEFYGMLEKIAQFKGKMKNPRWMKWMRTTDTNFGTETEQPALGAIDAINTLHAQFQDIDEELDKAN